MTASPPQPVFPGYFADPFVWFTEGAYFAIGTGIIEATGGADGSTGMLTLSGKPGVFALLRSTDLKRWTFAGAALEALDPEFGDAYWAPEVAHSHGLWWLYYSVGRGDKMHHLRVATASQPDGPYVDRGVCLTDPFRCPFAIDPSPFHDGGNSWYMFYASDVIDNSGGRTGTAVFCDRMVDMTRLAGEPRLVVQAKHDWQMYQASRIIYGSRYDWHTIEGPCVRKRNGRYWCLYSAGCWNSSTYGVDYAVADTIEGDWSDAGNETGSRVLRTVPGELIGPGHNSIVTTPSGEDLIAYHAWDPQMTARRMFIDPLEWTTDGPRRRGTRLPPIP